MNSGFYCFECGKDLDVNLIINNSKVKMDPNITDFNRDVFLLKLNCPYCFSKNYFIKDPTKKNDGKVFGSAYN